MTAAGLTFALVSAATLIGSSGAAIAAPVRPGLPGLIGAGISQPMTELTAGRYIVTLADDAVSTYDGGLDGFTATTPDTGKKLNPQSRASES